MSNRIDDALIQTNKTIDRLAAHIDGLDLRMESMFVAIAQTNATVNRLAEKVDQVAAKVDALVDIVAKHEARLAP